VKFNGRHLLVEHCAMNRLQLTSALKDESAVSTPEDVFGETNLIAESPDGRQDSIETWLLILTGFSSATFISSLISRSPQPHRLSWSVLFFQSAIYIALTAAAGAAGISIPWFFLKAKPSAKLPARRTSDLPTLYGLPTADSRPLRAFFIALCAQSALISAIAESFLLAGILLSTSLFLLVWRWSAFDSDATRRFAGRRPSTLLCALAIFITVLMLIPPVNGRLHSAFGSRNDLPHKPPSLANQPVDPDRPNTDYVGVILWPPPTKKEIIPPMPHPNSLAIGSASRPIIIPFDGPYWYFKAPSTKPGPRAHIAHGKSTDVTVRSSDWAPLLMEAHQNLGPPIDLACCSEIDVAVTNADTRPGTIALSLLLTDSNSIGKPSHDLGDRIIVSSEAAQIPMNRQPVKEVLRFPVSRSAAMRRFDEITIVFLPANERARGGAKVSIQSFTLIPR
jgi:hypothetical protein